MPSPVAPGSYLAMYRQRLVQNIQQSILSGMGTVLPNSPMMQNIDASLAGNVGNIDVMLSMVGLNTSSGSGQAALNPAGGAINALGSVGTGAPIIGPAQNAGLLTPTGSKLSLTA